MPDARTWLREGQLLVILREGTLTPARSAVDDILAVDFLLQHPSALARFAHSGEAAWNVASLPSATEMQSTEETLLRWKRAVAADVVGPMLGRLIGRGLVTHHREVLRLHPRGLAVADALAADMKQARLERAVRATADFREEPARAHDRLRRVLEMDDA